MLRRFLNIIKFKKLHTLNFSNTYDDVKTDLEAAVKMLDKWKDSYFEVRHKIEASGRDARWEFDRRKLFDRSDYISEVCKNLLNIAQVMPCRKNILDRLGCFDFSSCCCYLINKQLLAFGSVTCSIFLFP